MRESLDLPNIPEYVSIKEAAKMLGVSDKRVYAYIEDGRLSAVRAAHVIMIPVEEVKKFQPKISGRPRKNTPPWRTSPDNNKLFVTSIRVRVRPNKLPELDQELERIKKSDEFVFSGTIARYIVRSIAHPEKVEILLLWRSISPSDEASRKSALEAFQSALEDVFDWDTMEYDEGEAFLHT
ncbi:hypothetical protein KSC_063230 [Ktedonobacter sp. SOSP1-52]|uniref:helix-turn-helix domain-containing protein n=1 Tax=Ktedonobacter sp. SOSP1-52 TaxID=2778366 RepID=UPI0019163451|nr:helix-turn-helix domain-containing protein [Ktedonobacter sp. SOSP1-52]GHO67431.1 hypothetical protein KSC_063230 [Ktedonobacter sp. SOSP1-52]